MRIITKTVFKLSWKSAVFLQRPLSTNLGRYFCCYAQIKYTVIGHVSWTLNPYELPNNLMTKKFKFFKHLCLLCLGQWNSSYIGLHTIDGGPNYNQYSWDNTTNSADFNEKQKCHVDILQDTFPTLCQWIDFFYSKQYTYVHFPEHYIYSNKTGV